MLGDIVTTLDGIANGATMTYTPPSGERWAVSVWSTTDFHGIDTLYANVGETSSGSNKPRGQNRDSDNNTSYHSRMLPFVISDSQPLYLTASTGGSVIYTQVHGVKLN